MKKAEPVAFTLVCRPVRYALQYLLGLDESFYSNDGSSHMRPCMSASSINVLFSVQLENTLYIRVYNRCESILNNVCQLQSNNILHARCQSFFVSVSL